MVWDSVETIPDVDKSDMLGEHERIVRLEPMAHGILMIKYNHDT
jgi:hypothetical protein